MRKTPLGYVEIEDFAVIMVPGETDEERTKYGQMLYTQPGVFRFDNPEYFDCKSASSDELINAARSFVVMGTLSEYYCYTFDDIINLPRDDVAPFVADLLTFADYDEIDFKSEFYQYLVGIEDEYKHEPELHRIFSQLTRAQVMTIRSNVVALLNALNSINDCNEPRQDELRSIRATMLKSISNMKPILPKLPALKILYNGEIQLIKNSTMYNEITTALKNRESLCDIGSQLDILLGFVENVIAAHEGFRY
jgi:hypothetical protein